MHVLSFKRPRLTVQKLLQRDMKVLQKSEKNIVVAFFDTPVNHHWEKAVGETTASSQIHGVAGPVGGEAG